MCRAIPLFPSLHFLFCHHITCVTLRIFHLLSVQHVPGRGGSRAKADRVTCPVKPVLPPPRGEPRGWIIVNNKNSLYLKINIIIFILQVLLIYKKINKGNIFYVLLRAFILGNLISKKLRFVLFVDFENPQWCYGTSVI